MTAKKWALLTLEKESGTLKDATLKNLRTGSGMPFG
jgi:hypothetical protein